MTGSSTEDINRSWSHSGRSCSSQPDGSPAFTVSNRIREVALRTLTANRQAIPPALGTVCKTIVRVEQLAFTAKCNANKLSTILEIFDAVTRGVLDRWFDHAEADNNMLLALQKLVRKGKAAAVLCNKGRSARLVLGPKLSSDLADVKTTLIEFATVNGLAITDALYVSIKWFFFSTFPVFCPLSLYSSYKFVLIVFAY